MRTHDAGSGVIVYGPTERAMVLARISVLVDRLLAEQAFWLGDDLLPPLIDHA